MTVKLNHQTYSRRKPLLLLLFSNSASLWKKQKNYTKDCLSLPPLDFNFPWAHLQPPAMRQWHLNYNNCFRTSRSAGKAKATPEDHFKKPMLSREREKNTSCGGMESKTTRVKYSPITSQPEETGSSRRRGRGRTPLGCGLEKSLNPMMQI